MPIALLGPLEDDPALGLVGGPKRGAPDLFFVSCVRVRVRVP